MRRFHVIESMKRSRKPKTGGRRFPSVGQGLLFTVTALAIGLQLADTGLDLNEFMTSDTAHADAAGIVGLSEFLFGCLALLLYRYH